MFMSTDPWAGSIWRPATFNGYDYVGSNPINLGDPSGLDPWWCATDTKTLLSVPSYATQDAIGNCYRKHIGPPVPTDYSFAGSLAKNIPILGNLVQMAEDFMVMKEVSSYPQFRAEQRAFGEWQVANCPMGCHIAPDSIESQYGPNIWLQRGQFKPATPLMDVWGKALGDFTVNGEMLAADIFLAYVGCQVNSGGYINGRPHDLRIGFGLQNRKSIEELFATRDFDRPSNLIGATGDLQATNRYIYVIDNQGTVWTSRPGPHHPDLVGGAKVYGAGEMYIDRSGQIRLINNFSGHYLPDSQFFPYLKALLESKGLNIDPNIFVPVGD
jgi:hypothetical protein